MTTAQIFLHPRSIEYVGLFMLLSNLKDQGYDVPHVQRGKFYRAIPEPPPVRPPPTIEPVKARVLNFWWPRN